MSIEIPTELQKSTWGLPLTAHLLRAGGEVANISMDAEYDPTVESGRRRVFFTELERLRVAEEDERILSYNIRI